MGSESAVARVAVCLPLRTFLDFAVPADLASAVAVGGRVRVPVQGKPVSGIVIALVRETAHPGPLEPILSVDDGPRFSPEALSFALRVAEEDLSPAGLFVNRLLPRRARSKPAPPRAVVPALPVPDALDALQTLTRRAPRQAEVLRLVLGLPGPCPEPELSRRLGRSVRGPLNRLIEKGLVREVAPRSLTRTPPPGDRTTEEDGGTTLLFARERWDRYTQAAAAALGSGRPVLVLAPEILAADELHAHLDPAVPGGAARYHSAVSYTHLTLPTN